MEENELHRRDFLKLSATAVGTLLIKPLNSFFLFDEFSEVEQLGRVCVGKVELKAHPSADSQTVGVLYEDAVLPWLNETSGRRPTYSFNNQRWVETPKGYIYGPYFQPVKNQPNTPVNSLNKTSFGEGMWVEVTIPYVDAELERAPSSHSWVQAKLEKGMPLRFYYKQVFWVDSIKTGEDGKKYYRVNPNYYGGVDMLWADAKAFRPITKSELEPIHPDVIDKHIKVDVNHQVLICYEGQAEVYYCKVSTGAKFDMYGNLVDKWETPVGLHKISRKFISLQMSGGTTGAGYDLPGIGWTSIFATGGVAIHSTFWHNNFGDPVSHGCVNTRPEDAKWIFRWTLPTVLYDPGMVDTALTGEESTQVKVIEI